MDAFEILFGVERSAVKGVCVVMPFIRKEVLKRFGVEKLSRGKLYAAADCRNFTLIQSGVGPAFTGDAVLHLGETGCRSLLFWGACGLLRPGLGLGVGSLATPSEISSLESFTGILSGEVEPAEVPGPEVELQRELIGSAGGPLKEVSCLTVGSLKLQDEKAESFLAKGADVVDLECASFFAAAYRSDLPAAALLTITDIVGTKPFYLKPDPEDRAALSASSSRAVEIICGLIEEKLNG